MREIIPELLWLGHARDARDLRMLHERGIVAVVDVAAEEEPAKLSRDMMYCRYPLVDGGDNDRATLSLAIQQVTSLIRLRIPMLVTCGAGMSRSPAIVAAAMAVVENEDPDVVLSRVVGDNPHDVSPWLWEEIKIAIAR